MAKKVDRAAQFLPFDALKGLQEELKAREDKRTRVQKIELSEEHIEEVSNTLMQIESGSEIEVTHYKNGHYYTLIGIVQKIDVTYKFLVVGEEKIFFDNIYKISIRTV